MRTRQWKEVQKLSKKLVELPSRETKQQAKDSYVLVPLTTVKEKDAHSAFKSAYKKKTKKKRKNALR